MLKGNKERLLTIALVLGVLLVVVGGLSYSFFSSTSKRSRQSAIACTLDWARLAPFPATIRNLSIKTEGGFLTRSFRIQFSVPQEELNRWITNSPGLRETTPQLIAPHKSHYPINPGGGASHAEADINGELVSIYVSWS